MFVNDEPLSEYDHVDHKAIYLNFPLLFRHKPIVFFGRINTQESHQECSEKYHPIVGRNLVNVLQKEKSQIV